MEHPLRHKLGKLYALTCGFLVVIAGWVAFITWALDAQNLDWTPPWQFVCITTFVLTFGWWLSLLIYTSKISDLASDLELRVWGAHREKVAEREYAEGLAWLFLERAGPEKLDLPAARTVMQHLARACQEASDAAEKALQEFGHDSDKYQTANDRFKDAKKLYWATAQKLQPLREKKKSWKEDLPHDLREDAEAA